MNRTSFQYLLGGIILTCLLTTLLLGGGLGDELVREKSLDLSGVELPRYSVGDHSQRSLVISSELASLTTNPVVVLAMTHEVQYIDGETLRLLKTLRFSDNEYVTVSQNGRFVSIFTKFAHRRTGKTLWKMRIEDWSGQRLWEMDFQPSGHGEPTPTGGFVTYTTAHPRETTGDRYDPDILPHSFPHSLLVYDQQGQLVLEGIGYEESRTTYNCGKISDDGKYLAFLFRWIPPEIRDERRFGIDSVNDRACVVFYDLEEAVEQWRFYFEGNKPRHLAIGPGGDRILCCVTNRGSKGPASDEHRIYSFDTDGNKLFEHEIERDERTAAPAGLQMSPDGRLCAIRTTDGSVSVMCTDTGEGIHRWEGPTGVTGFGQFVVDNAGRVTGHGTIGCHDIGVHQPRIFIMEGNRESALVLSADRLRLGSGVDLGLSDDGQTLWLKDMSSIGLYRLGSQ